MASEYRSEGRGGATEWGVTIALTFLALMRQTASVVQAGHLMGSVQLLTPADLERLNTAYEEYLLRAPHHERGQAEAAMARLAALMAPASHGGTTVSDLYESVTSSVDELRDMAHQRLRPPTT